MQISHRQELTLPVLQLLYNDIGYKKCTMKNLLIYVAVPLLLFYGCEDFLDKKPIANPTVEEYYNNINDLQNALNAVYAVLRENNYCKSEWIFGEGCSDNVVRHESFSKDNQIAKLMEFNNFATGILPQKIHK